MSSTKGIRGSDAASPHQKTGPDVAVPCRASTPTVLEWGVVILAAGASVRMGRPKMLLPWGRTTVLGRVVSLARQFGEAQIAVVVPAGDVRLDMELRRLRVPAAWRIANRAPKRGMFSSVQCAARWPGWKRGLTHWAIMLGDQPQLRPASIRRLADFAARHPQKICQPARARRPRHPVVLPAHHFCRLATTRHRTLKNFLEARSADVRLIEIDDRGLDYDLDSPADYRRLRRAG
jgi:molybdenum cofactor cytidylyltransferase